MLSQAYIYIKGDVIGVGYRVWLRIHAKMANLKGWVRNSHDRPEIFGPGGGVEALIQGEKENVEKLIETATKGPPTAHVEDVEVLWQEPKEIFEAFEIRR